MTVYNTYVRLSSAERYTAGAVHCSDTWHQVVLLRSECHLLQIPSLGEPGCGRVFTVLSCGYHCIVTCIHCTVTWFPRVLCGGTGNMPGTSKLTE